MYLADLTHPDPSLAAKLEALYNLRTDKKIALGFREPFLKLLEAFGNPHLSLPPTIHVAGTNGKGSVVATLRSLLEAHGKTVSAFTSPHLLQFNERLYASGTYISNPALNDLIDEALALNKGGKVTFFEITTAMAFAWFARQKTDYCLLEVGLGGRLDCTNVIQNPAACVITNISYDHQQFLGNTLSEIAGEKAGIMKPYVPCIIAPQKEATALPVFENRAAQTGCNLFIAGRDWSMTSLNDMMRFKFESLDITLPRPNLAGDHQLENASAALAALHAIDPVWNENKLAAGLQNIHWPGRLENITNAFAIPQTDIWYDGGCNDSAGAALEAQIKKWQEEDPRDLHLIVGMKGDKNAENFLRYLAPHAKTLTIVPIPGLSSCLSGQGFPGELTAPDVPAAIRAIAGNSPQKPKRILITGSLYLAQQIGQNKTHEQKAESKRHA